GSKIHQVAAHVLKVLGELNWIPILLARMTVGLLFFESGRGKLFFKLEELGKYFAQLGIPFPELNAFTVASIQFFGGMCLIIGLGTRVFSAVLAVIMLVALFTAQIQTVHTVGDFLYLPEVLLVVILVWIVFSGPGKISIDHVLALKMRKKSI
ncbi:MAG: DoxX family protein, partial [Candidatus Methylomirabilales bacterium]